MGDLQVCSPRPHGISLGEDCSCPRLSTLPFPSLNPDPSLTTEDNWARAENTISDIILRIQPTLATQQKREQVIDYVQGLIRTRIGCEVFPFGSVPLKTYLPDGDIDLTALCCSKIENAVVSDVHAVLKGQENNGISQYEVKDVHCIDAEVKLVKCIVQNVVVDISFNQLGGLCTLCFLEQVDRLVGKDHLFKRSIILIKAWCYYESRILGAHHGLISTYALETLVLYIFHLFHKSLHGPLAVLHRFLEYFSKFDWDNYCISLRGPVNKSSLPDIIAEVPENNGHELLLSEDFLRNCNDMFSVSSKGSEPSLRVFTLKHLNIIDPLKEINNLGRSVNRGNFYRIRSAFKYGARKLGWILLLPEERIEAELNKFYDNTLDRHCWTNAQFPALESHIRGSLHSYAPSETCSVYKAGLESTLALRIEKISGTDISLSKASSTASRLTENVQKLNTTVIANASSANDTPDLHAEINVIAKNYYCAPQNGLLGLIGSEKTEILNTGCAMALKCVHNNEICFTLEVEPEGEPVASGLHCLYNDNKISIESLRSAFHSSEDVSCGLNKRCNEGTRSFEVGKKLDLCGDYDSYVRNLQYGQICDSYARSPTLPLSPPLPVYVQKNYRCQAIHQSVLCNHNIPSRFDRNGFTMVRVCNSLNHFDLVSEENKRPQGIGTYFPRTNTRIYRDRQFQAKEKTQGRMTESQFQRHDCSNELSTTPQETSIMEDSHGFLEDEFPVLGNCKLGSSDSPPSSYISRWRTTPHGIGNGNGIPWPHEEPESWPICLEPQGAATLEAINQSEQATSGSTTEFSAIETPNPAENKQERDTKQLFHLKNDEDFPPLSH